MLLIISANQKDNLVTNKALQDAKQELILTGSQVVESGSGVLTDLVKMLDDSEKIPEIKAEKKVVEVAVDVKETIKDIKEDIVSNEASVKSNVDTSDKKNVIASFFDRFKKKPSEDTMKVSEDVVAQEDKEVEVVKQEKPKADVVVVKKQASTKKEYKKMEYKKGTFRDIPTYNGQFSVNQKPLP